MYARLKVRVICGIANLTFPIESWHFRRLTPLYDWRLTEAELNGSEASIAVSRPVHALVRRLHALPWYLLSRSLGKPRSLEVAPSQLADPRMQ